jgi:hypothetical protein
MVIYPQGSQRDPASVLGGGSGDDAEAPPNSESSQKRNFMVTAPFRETEAHGQLLTTGQGNASLRAVCAIGGRGTSEAGLVSKVLRVSD